MATKVQIGKISGRDGVPAGTDYGVWIGDGALVVYNGTTVVIDGTSNMFKIVASGSVSITIANNAVTQTSDTVLSGLGTWDSIPLCVGGISGSDAVTGNIRALNRDLGVSFGYVAGSSGGSPTFKVVSIANESSLTSYVTAGDNFAGIRIAGSNFTGSSITQYARYQLCKEAAL